VAVAKPRERAEFASRARRNPGPAPRYEVVRPPRARDLRAVVWEELRRLATFEERHRRLLARLLIAFGITLCFAVAGSLLIYFFESGKKGSDVHGFGDAAFFSAVQLLTVSSSLKNPVTVAGKIVDVGLEAWAVFVVTAVAGSFASFFSSGDSSTSS